MTNAHAMSDMVEDSRRSMSLKNWGPAPAEQQDACFTRDAVAHCGWGRLLFGQTFASAQGVAELLGHEAPGQRDLAFYVREPQVVLAAAPQRLFLDPSHTFRLDLESFAGVDERIRGLRVRSLSAGDEAGINRLYLACGMVPLAEGFCAGLDESGPVSLLVAEEAGSDANPVGVVMGVDHKLAFGDPDDGASLWALAVDPQAPTPRIGEALTVALAERFRHSGRGFMDLSVMHDNERAIALYRKLGFQQVPVYCIKCKNPINERLFVGPQPEAALNIYARIIVDEARRRGITVEIEDAEAGLFKMTHGGRSVSCREALSEMTSAVALSRCDDKALTRRLLKRAGLSVPEQIPAHDPAAVADFLERHRRLVVKPARGEMGHGVSVDLRSEAEVADAIERAGHISEEVIVEQLVAGEDLRIIVIDGAVAAAAVRRPPAVRGNGVHTVIELIEKQSRRRAAATHGESRIPLDEETERCVASEGLQMLDVPEEGRTLAVRKTANLHAGGTIHDVTAVLHPVLAEAAVKAAQVLDMPVVGFDFLVDAPDRPRYVVIEANERPGLANHEPQPTAERFVDFLFPQTRPTSEVEADSE